MINEPDRLLLDWQESGVAIAVEDQAKQGFGRRLIENSLGSAVNAKTQFTLGADGLRCRIEIPLG